MKGRKISPKLPIFLVFEDFAFPCQNSAHIGILPSKIGFAFPLSACFIEMASSGFWAGDLKFDAAAGSTMDAYLYLDGEFKLWKIATTAELPKRGGGEVHHRRFFLLHLLPFKVPDGMKLPRSILTCSCSFLLICMCLRINVQFGGNFL